MRLATWAILGFSAALLMSLGCSSDSDTSTAPVADGACSDNTGNRFVDCGNGTVTDTTSGLIWLKSAACLGAVPWDAAMASVAALQSGACGLTDNSSAAAWRLPTKVEWEATVKPSCSPTPGEPTLPDMVGTGCFVNGTQWATGVEPEYYWSSTFDPSDPDRAFYVNLSGGDIGIYHKQWPNFVWPVRGVQ